MNLLKPDELFHRQVVVDLRDIRCWRYLNSFRQAPVLAYAVPSSTLRYSEFQRFSDRDQAGANQNVKVSCRYIYIDHGPALMWYTPFESRIRSDAPKPLTKHDKYVHEINHTWKSPTLMYGRTPCCSNKI